MHLRSLIGRCLLAAMFLPSPVFAQSVTNGTAEAELAIKKFQLAPGLKVELFAAEPLLENPVAFDIDHQGRFFVVETHRYREAIFDVTRETNWLVTDLSFRTVAERAQFLALEFRTNLARLTKDSELIRRVEDRDGDGRAETSRVFADGFRETVSGTAAGVLARKDGVWFTCIPDVWRMDYSANGLAGERRKLRSGFGVHVSVSGHDLHGVTMGPDGKIYFSVGDRGFEPPPDIKGFGFTTAFLRRILPDTGAVYRCNPDGSDFEVFAIGMRNPQDLVFDAQGNLWTDDNDTAGEDKSRLLHVVRGGDYGWRGSYQYMSGFGPWVQENLWQGGLDDVLPPAGEAAQGPSGLVFNPGTALNEKYRNHFFVCDFPGGVWSFSVKPKGASFEITGREKFLWNTWPTDLGFGVDGALYMSDWTEGWSPAAKGRLYRIDDPAKPDGELREETRRLLAEGMEKSPAPELMRLLAHADMRVRLEAQWELVKRKEAGALMGVVKGGGFMFARLHGIWGLKQLGAGDTALLLKAARNDPAEEVRGAAWQWLGVFGQKVTKADLEAGLKDASAKVQFEVLQACAGMSVSKAGRNEWLASYLSAASKDPFCLSAVVNLLTQESDLGTVRSLSKHSDANLRRAGLLVMRRLERPEIAQFLNDPEPRLVAEAARAINDVPIPEAMPALAARLSHKDWWATNSPAGTVTATAVEAKNLPAHGGGATAGESPKRNWSEQILWRSINASFRLGQPANAIALAEFASHAQAPVTLRAEALKALADWAKPYPLDKVMGLWRPLPERDATVARAAVQTGLRALIEESPAPVQIAAADCAVRLGLATATPGLSRAFHHEQTAPAVRVEMLRALGEMEAKELPAAVKSALADTNAIIRRAGVQWLAKVETPDAVLQLERMLAGEKDFRLVQAAYTTLGELKNPAADEVLVRQLVRLPEGKVRPETRLELFEAAHRRTAATVQEALRKVEASRPDQSATAGWGELVLGGNAADGRKIFLERANVECLRCHQVRGQGGIVGPALDGIGKRQTREYILEAILTPNAKIAPGFENVLIILKNGGNHAGLLKQETETQLVVESPEDGLLRLEKSTVQEKRRGLSAMPEGMDKLLSKRDLRDLVEYLASLK